MCPKLILFKNLFVVFETEIDKSRVKNIKTGRQFSIHKTAFLLHVSQTLFPCFFVSLSFFQRYFTKLAARKTTAAHNSNNK